MIAGQIWSDLYEKAVPPEFQLREDYQREFVVRHFPDGRAFLELRVSRVVNVRRRSRVRRITESAGSYPLKWLPEFSQLDEVGRIHGLDPRDAAGDCEECTESYESAALAGVDVPDDGVGAGSKTEEVKAS